MKSGTHVDWSTVPERSGDIVFSGRLCAEDLMNLRLDPLDRAVITSPITSAADLFQTLEIVFRRMAEQAPEGESAK